MFETQAVTFHEVLEMVEMLPEEEQETLLDIIQRRLRERGRERIAQNVMKARAEYAKSEIRQGTVEDLIREIDANTADNECIDADIARDYKKEGLQMPSVKAVVDELVKEYFDIEEGIKSIIWVNPNQEKEIWLIEVDMTAIPAGRVEPFYFKPNEEVPYPVRIANITPDEWKAVKEGAINMPEGWTLDGTERVFTRAK